jgi:predicted metal-dependent enzyme (double-stranded beta helix superfamily)
VLDAATIHAISNPLPTPARGIHVYGKDLVVTKRRMWHPHTGAEMAMHLPTFERWEHELTLAHRTRRRRADD